MSASGPSGPLVLLLSGKLQYSRRVYKSTNKKILDISILCVCMGESFQD